MCIVDDEQSKEDGEEGIVEGETAVAKELSVVMGEVELGTEVAVMEVLSMFESGSWIPVIMLVVVEVVLLSDPPARNWASCHSFSARTRTTGMRPSNESNVAPAPSNFFNKLSKMEIVRPTLINSSSDEVVTRSSGMC